MSARTSLVLALVLLPIAVVAGCSSEPSKPAPAQVGNAGPPSASPGGSNEAGAVSDAGGDSALDAEGGVCNSIAEGGGSIEQTGFIGDPPTAGGGTLVDGTYDLTDDKVYLAPGGFPGPTGLSTKATIVISGTTINEAMDTGPTGKTATSSRITSSFTTTGVTLAMTESCPTNGGQQLQYTVTNSTLVLIDAVKKEAFTFTMH